jgi:zinc transport system ATP-binding protein
MDESLPLIEVSGVTFGYGREAVLEGIDLTVGGRDFLVLEGPNGGGKTTLLKLMLGLLSPWRGEVKRHLGRRRGGIGYVPQFSAFDRTFPLRVESLVLMGRLAHRGLLRPYDRDDRREAARALDRLRLTHLAKLPIADLSGGEAQRVLIARALAGDPQILMLDEPTSSVDPQSRGVLASVLVDLNRRIPVVVVTHDLASFAGQATHIAHVHRTLATQAWPAAPGVSR